MPYHKPATRAELRNIGSITTADTIPLYEPGTTFEVHTAKGTEKESYRYIYNGEASSSIAAKDTVVSKTTATTAAGVSHGVYNRGVGILSTGVLPRPRVLGCAYYTIAAGSYGFVKYRGTQTITAGGAISAGVSIVSSSSGDVETIGSNDGAAAIGICTVAAGGAGDVTVLLDIPD